MTTLKGIKGDQIRYLDQDPVVQGIAGGSWAADANLDGDRYASRATGTTSAGLMVTGYNDTVYLSTSIEYDGTSWGNPATMNTPLTNNRTAIGVQTAAITASGYQSPINSTIAAVELYDGATWTTGTAVNSARSGTGGAGIQTSAAIFGGTPTALSPSNPGTIYTGATEIWNGTSWTEVNDLNTTRRSMSYFGATPSPTAIAIAGARSPAPGVASIVLTNVETWNGTSWTETTEVNTARENESGGGAGTSQSNGIVFGGYVGPAGTVNTEYYNGSSWTELNNLASARYGNVGFGSSSSAITAGNYPPLSSANTSEIWSLQPSNSLALQEGMLWFNSTSQTLKGYAASGGIPAATWSSGGSLNTARNNVAGTNSGTPTATLAFGGYTGTAPTGATESYNGTSWTELNDFNTSRLAVGSVGTSTAALAIGGATTPPTTPQTNVETWNGTSWTETTDINTARDNIHGGFGGQTLAVIGGGRTAAPATFTGATESWNGTSWTEVNDLNTARGTNHSSPSTSDGIAAGGYVAPPTAYNGLVETWNGTSWTETTDLNTARGTAGSSGTSGSAFLLFGGENPGSTANQLTESWNGTAWTEVNDLATPHSAGVGGSGTSIAALAFGGSTVPGAQTGATEEWTATAAVVTVTTS